MIEDLEQQIQDKCRFCNPPEKERILHETENFYIMLSLGPIVEGYLLLVSKSHISCCAEIPKGVTSEFDSLYKMAKEILIKEYGQCICYEHGRAGSCLIPAEGSKHCFHAHMHFVPVKASLNKEIAKEFSGLLIKDLSEFRTSYKKTFLPYLFVDDGEKIIYTIEDKLRSQYLRFKTAKAIGKEELWDWVNHQGWDKINSGKLKLRHSFKNR